MYQIIKNIKVILTLRSAKITHKKVVFFAHKNYNIIISITASIIHFSKQVNTVCKKNKLDR